MASPTGTPFSYAVSNSTNAVSSFSYFSSLSAGVSKKRTLSKFAFSATMPRSCRKAESTRPEMPEGAVRSKILHGSRKYVSRGSASKPCQASPLRISQKRRSVAISCVSPLSHGTPSAVSGCQGCISVNISHIFFRSKMPRRTVSVHSASPASASIAAFISNPAKRSAFADVELWRKNDSCKTSGESRRFFPFKCASRT